MADVAEVDLSVDMEEEGNIGVVDKMLEFCDATTDNNWRFTRHMT